MPFCVNCGAQNREGARFCEACGKPVTQIVAGAPKPAAPTPGVPQPAVAPAQSTGMAKSLTLAAVGIYAVAAMLTLLSGNVLDLIFSLALGVGIYLAVYGALAKGNLAAAKKGAMIGGIVSLLFILFSFINGSAIGALLNAAAAACMGLAWNSIKP